MSWTYQGEALEQNAGYCPNADINDDGKPDLFLVSADSDGVSRLLHNLGEGRFEDVTERSGIVLKGSGLGRENGWAAIEDLTEEKAVTIAL